MCLDLNLEASAYAKFLSLDKSKDWEKQLWSGCRDLKEGSICLPSCDGKQCGPDGCGGFCGEHDGKCEDGYECQSDGTCKCIPNCDDKICGSDGCGGQCPNGCDALGDKYQCIETTTGGICACVPDCSGKQCGSDGCGGECPNTCHDGQRCNDSFQCEDIPDTCVSNCYDRQCGPDPICGRPCPLGAPGQCSGQTKCNSSVGRCCAVNESFAGAIGGPYSGELVKLLSGPSGSSAELVTDTVVDIPSGSPALRVFASRDGGPISLATTVHIPKDAPPSALPFRRLETMVRVAPAHAPSDSTPGALIGFLSKDTAKVVWGLVFNNKDHNVYVPGSSTPLGTFQNDRWYKVIIRGNDDFSKAFVEVVDVGGTWVDVPAGLTAAACLKGVECRIGFEVLGSRDSHNLNHVLPVPQTIYVDDFFACN